MGTVELLTPGLTEVSELLTPGLTEVPELLTPGLTEVPELLTPGLTEVPELLTSGQVIFTSKWISDYTDDASVNDDFSTDKSEVDRNPIINARPVLSIGLSGQQNIPSTIKPKRPILIEGSPIIQNFEIAGNALLPRESPSTGVVKIKDAVIEMYPKIVSILNENQEISQKALFEMTYEQYPHLFPLKWISEDGNFNHGGKVHCGRLLKQCVKREGKIDGHRGSILKIPLTVIDFQEIFKE
jgi:hypothetical protein